MGRQENPHSPTRVSADQQVSNEFLIRRGAQLEAEKQTKLIAKRINMVVADIGEVKVPLAPENQDSSDIVVNTKVDSFHLAAGAYTGSRRFTVFPRTAHKSIQSISLVSTTELQGNDQRKDDSVQPSSAHYPELYPQETFGIHTKNILLITSDRYSKAEKPPPGRGKLRIVGESVMQLAYYFGEDGKKGKVVTIDGSKHTGDINDGNSKLETITDEDMDEVFGALMILEVGFDDFMKEIAKKAKPGSVKKRINIFSALKNRSVNNSGSDVADA